jgi:hypothetical protein
MTRLKIDDLPKNSTIAPKEMRKVVGGSLLSIGDLKYTESRFVPCEPVQIMTRFGPGIAIKYSLPY